MRVYHRHFPRSTVPFSETFEMWIILAGIAVSYAFLRYDVITWLIEHVSSFALIGSFVQGFFFTSMLTTIPATVAIVKSASFIPTWELALIGGLGSTAGDLLVFRFLRTKLVGRILAAAFNAGPTRVGARLSKGAFAWVPSFGGFFILASPLPDEIGLVMMGLSRIPLWSFALLNFAAHAVGIFLLALTAQSVT